MFRNATGVHRIASQVCVARVGTIPPSQSEPVGGRIASHVCVNAETSAQVCVARVGTESIVQ